MPDSRKVLIVGAGPAGATLALCLRRFGIQPTIIEKAARGDMRGYAVGLHVNAWNVAERLGVLDRLKARSVKLGKAVFRDRGGRRMFTYDYKHFLPAAKGRVLGIMRDALQEVLLEEVLTSWPIRFGTVPKAICQTQRSVTVTLNDGTTSEFDLVVGADGVGSTVRDLVFGSSKDFVQPLGYRAAAWRVHRALEPGLTLVAHVDVDHQAGFYAAGEGSVATLFCWRDQDRTFVPREDRQALLRHRFVGWHPEVEATLAQPVDWSHSFFGTVDQIVMPSWSQRRVALLGDAACCMTFLSGQGTSMAMAGAWILAEELAAKPVDEALVAYERRLRGTVERIQEISNVIATSFVPTSRNAMRVQALLAPAFFNRWVLPRVARRIAAPELALSET